MNAATRPAERHDARPLVEGRLDLPRCPRMPADLLELVPPGPFVSRPVAPTPIREITLVPSGFLPWEIAS